MEAVNTKRINSTLWDWEGKFDYVDEWFLMRSPLPLLGLWLIYLIFVLKLGPAYMKGRAPFQLTRVLIVYNVLQVVISYLLFHTGFAILCIYGILQKDCITNSADVARLMAGSMYCYFLAKISELLETIFFVLRKKHGQVSFLHLYHHSTTMLISWGIVKYDPSSQLVLLGTLNSFVHIVMYTYYALSAFHDLQKYLWWKTHITKLQLLQFVANLVYLFLEHKYTQCQPSYMLLGIISFNLVLLIVLFGNFYVKSYLNKNTSKPKMGQNEHTTKDVNGSKYYVKEKEDDIEEKYYTNEIYKHCDLPDANKKYSGAVNIRKNMKFNKDNKSL